MGGMVNARGLNHNKIALVLVFGGFLQATDHGLCHLDQTGLFGRVTVNLIKSAQVLSDAFTGTLGAYLVVHVRIVE
jgi:hypothetical protein